MNTVKSKGDHKNQAKRLYLKLFLESKGIQAVASHSLKSSISCCIAASAIPTPRCLTRSAKTAMTAQADFSGI